MTDGANSLGVARGSAQIDVGPARAALRQLEQDVLRSQATLNGYTGKTQPLAPKVDTRPLRDLEEAARQLLIERRRGVQTGAMACRVTGSGRRFVARSTCMRGAATATSAAAVIVW